MITIKKYLPSRLVVAFFIVPIIAFILFLSFKYMLIKSNEKEFVAKKAFLKTLDKQLNDNDTDKDGLMDWEERLYNTDINKSDTDGDGIPDGLEVKKGTDPLDPLNILSKKREKIEKITDNEEVTDNTNLTKTSIISRDFLLKIAELKGSKLINNKSAKEFIVDELVNENIVKIKNRYTKNDLNIDTISDNELKKNFIKITSSSGMEKMEDDFVLYALYIEKKDEDSLVKLKKNLSVYKKYEENLRVAKINNSISDVYLKYLNTVGNFVDIVEMMTKAEDDPFLAVQGFEKYISISDKLEVVIKELGLYFNK